MNKTTLKAACFCLLVIASSTAVVGQDAQKVSVDGKYTASIYEQLAAHQYGTNNAAEEKIVKEPWTFKQDGNKVTGTEKTDKAELPITAMLDGRVVRGYVTDGDKRYLINLDVDPDDGAMHGSIRMGIHEYLLNLVKSK
jgi:hypothetical protein